MLTPTVAGVVPSHYIHSFHHKKSPEMLLHVRGWDVSCIEFLYRRVTFPSILLVIQEVLVASLTHVAKFG